MAIIGWDSKDIERIAHDGINLYVEFKKNNSGYKYFNVPFEIYQRIMNKECISKSEVNHHMVLLFLIW